MSAKICSITPQAKKMLYCDFCGVTELEAEYLINAPLSDICICADCVGISVKILKTHRAGKRVKEKSAKAGK